MVSDAGSGGMTDGPQGPVEGQPGEDDLEGTGVWDVATAWEDEDAEAEAVGAPGDEWPEGAWQEQGWEGPEGYSPEAYSGEGGYDPETGYGPDGEYYGPPGPSTYPGYEEQPYEPGYEPSYDPAYDPAYVPEAPVAVRPARPPRPPRERRPRRRGRGPWPELVIIAAVAVIAAAAILVYTNQTNANVASNPPTSLPAPTISTSAPPSTQAATSTSTATGGASTTANPTAFAVAANPAWETGVLSSWVNYEKATGIGPADVAGFVPGHIEFAETPATGTWWALAVFEPSATLRAESSTAAGQAMLAEFTNTEYALSWQDGKTWTVLGQVQTGDCPGIWVPTPVLKAWGLCGLHPPRMPPS